jgi:23S rRNA (cytidine2498-2'-O)-methyltransferase
VSYITSETIPTFILTAHQEFIDAAYDELKRINDKLHYRELLAPGILLCTFSTDIYSLDLSSFIRQVRQQCLIFVRHLAPVQAMIPLSNTENDIGELALSIANLPTFALLERGQRFSVQTRLLQTDAEIAKEGSMKHSYSSGQVNRLLAQAIAEETGAVESIKKPQVVISLLCTLQKAYIGISPAADNLSDWPGGARHYAYLPEQISRAEFKLLEALEVFGVTLPDRGLALDLGAAPGGWARILLESGMQVIAVDPAKLDARLSNRPHIEHYRGYAEDYLEEALKKRRKFDIITNDMRMDAREAARLLVQASVCLRNDGFIISVLKLPHETYSIDPLKNLNEALRLLQKYFDVVQAKQLFHNRQEVTVLTARPG